MFAHVFIFKLELVTYESVEGFFWTHFDTELKVTLLN